MRIQTRRAGVKGKRPSVDDLLQGELAYNYFDGTLNIVQDTGGVGVATRLISINNVPPGNTWFVATNGDDLNQGNSSDFPFLTIKKATGVATSGDVIKVDGGTYIEDNPIVMQDFVTLAGADLRNTLIQPLNKGLDLIQLGQATTVQDVSFIGEAENSAAVIAYRPLVGVASDRFFDAARLIRRNLKYIKNEAVGFTTSALSGFAGSITDQDVNTLSDNVSNIFLAIAHDITRGGNSKCIGAAKTFFNEDGSPIGFTATNAEATIATLDHSFKIARSVINNVPAGQSPVGTAITVTAAEYDNVTGLATITTSGPHGLQLQDAVKLVGLGFTCPGGGSETTFPSGSYGYHFDVLRVISSTQFETPVGISTLVHTYTSGGTVQEINNFREDFFQVRDLSIQNDPVSLWNRAPDGCANVLSAVNTCIGIVTSTLQSYLDNAGLGTAAPLPWAGLTTTYPGNAGAGQSDPDAIPSQGVGIIRKGPYIINCTNFVKNSIGARVDGFNADEGDKENDLGIQGSFNVDSYTQFNQGGIGVSVSNGAYCQLVSIFTICCDTAISASKGGQLDLTNSNSSFGTRGLVSIGVGDAGSSSEDRYTAFVHSGNNRGKDTITLSGVGSFRPYNGQAVYFDKIYKTVEDILVTNGGEGYTLPPRVTVQSPTGPGNAISAQATSTIDSQGRVVSVNLLSQGLQYEFAPSITITPQSGDTPSVSAAATAIMTPIYYGIESATEPSAGVSTVSLAQALNNDVGIGTTAYFSRQSLQVASSHTFEYIGAGNTIEFAYPSRGGVSNQENEVVKENGGELVYTSTDERGNFRVGDGVIINQTTGTISGRDYSNSLFVQITPIILALGGD